MSDPLDCRVIIKAGGEVYLACFTQKGLASLEWPGSFSASSAEAAAGFASAWAARLGRQLDAYLKGGREGFDIPMDLSAGTGFQQVVWHAIARIRYGQWQSYGELAKAIGRPRAIRAVGSACGANPVPLVIPCHRVLAAKGGLGGFGAGLERKRELLSLEGIVWKE